MFFFFHLLENYKNLEKYCFFYFVVLQTDKERSFFIENFKDEYVKNILIDISNLFIQYPIKSQEIKDFMSRYLILDEKNQTIVNEYQLSFLRSINSEFNFNGKSLHYDAVVKNNTSFSFIAPQTELKKDLLYMDLYFEANKEKMNKQERDEFMFKRVLKASFG